VTGRKPRDGRPRPAARPRTPGRPAAGLPDQREALIDAARDEFAAHGVAATSLRRVAAAAHVTPALANYYFRDKAGLLEAVLEHRVVPLVQGLAAAIGAAGGDPQAALTAFVRHYTATAAANPWLPQLIVREVLNAEGALRDVFPRRFAGGMAAALRGVVATGKERGVFRADLDTSAIVMSIVSLCIFPFVAVPMVVGTLGIDTSPDNAGALADHHLAVLQGGIARTP
jgi:TetR/AcrR family transcriptional regulator